MPKILIINLAYRQNVLKLKILNFIIKERNKMKSIKVKGMTCQHCVMAVTKALGALEGIKNVQVDLKSGLATYEEVKPVDPQKIAAAIKKAGYEVVG
jgi:copper chaperone